MASGGDGGWMWYGWMWMWWVDVEAFFFFSSLLLFLVAVDLACGGDGGWMWWLWYGWVDVVGGSVGLRKRETEESETKREEE